VFAFSSLGFAVLGLILGPDHKLGQEHRPELEVQILRPDSPQLDPLVEFWEEAGFHLFKREASYILQPYPRIQENSVWMQGQEEWVLVPQSPGLDLESSLFQLCSGFLLEGWVLQIEAAEHGYHLGFWSSTEGSDHRVLALEWKIERLNPHNYRQHAGGVIPVLGESFDPLGFLKRTPEAPVLAIIIDDWGHYAAAAEPLLAFPLPLTAAVLPLLDLSADLAERAHAAGHEVILHQPMEALDTSLPLGPGGIYRDMDLSDLVSTLRANLASLPEAVGVSNHMGSLVTEDHQAMKSILEIVDELGLFFLDSRTSSRSVVSAVAAELGVSFGANDLFIDNDNDVEKIKGQIRAGLRLAKQQGHAVVIGHVRSATADALWDMVPELLSSGVELVPISQMLFSASSGQDD
jgi:polysaccharide deacetylase 2 family uncharacterized protein YibQ